jgi:hypothetical protein
MTDGAGHEIPYSIQYSPDPTNPGAIKTLNCFGFTCSLDDEGDRYIIGRKNSMKLHSSDGTSYTLPANEGYGHDFLIYNLLYIPATTYPGVYQTTGNPGYEHLMVSWY